MQEVMQDTWMNSYLYLQYVMTYLNAPPNHEDRNGTLPPKYRFDGLGFPSWADI